MGMLAYGLDTQLCEGECSGLLVPVLSLFIFSVVSTIMLGLQVRFPHTASIHTASIHTAYAPPLHHTDR